jgi:hypothetical protein
MYIYIISDCVDNIEMDLRVIGEGGIDWINMVHSKGQSRAFANLVMSPWFHEVSGSYWVAAELELLKKGSSPSS